MTKRKFQTYLEIQKSGATNMFDVKRVIGLAGGELSTDDCIDIMENYAEYESEFRLSVKKM